MTNPVTPCWLGTLDTGRVAADVPAAIRDTIISYELARCGYESEDRLYRERRDSGQPCDSANLQFWQRARATYWGRLESLLPIEPGWWPVHGYLYGWAKRSKCGFELVRERGYSAWPDEAKAKAHAEKMAIKAAAEKRLQRGFQLTGDRT